MDCEHRVLLIRTLEFIEATCDEILRLRHGIELARITIDQSHDLIVAHRTSICPAPSVTKSL